MKLISWNIWGGRRLNDVISFLKSENPDIVALQEVSEREVDGVTHNDAEKIASSLGYKFFYGKAFTTDRHFPTYSLGNAILSRFEIKDPRAFELSGLPLYRKNSITEPRNAVVAQISIAEKTDISIISTHLGFSNTSDMTPVQSIQSEKLLSSLPQSKFILAADVNSQKDSELLNTLSLGLKKRSPQAYEVGELIQVDEIPEYRIDYVFVTSDITATNFRIPDSAASDHLPLVVEFEV